VCVLFLISCVVLQTLSAAFDPSAFRNAQGLSQEKRNDESPALALPRSSERKEGIGWFSSNVEKACGGVENFVVVVSAAVPRYCTVYVPFAISCNYAN